MLFVKFPSDENAEFASAGQFIAQNHPVHPRRTLDSHVLLIGCGGEYPISQNGVDYVLRDRTFMLLPAGREHYGTSPASTGQSHLWCHFFLPPDRELIESADLPKSSSDGYCVIPAYGEISHMETLRILFRQLIDAEYKAYADEATRKNVCDSYLRVILCELCDDCLSRELEKQNKNAQKYGRKAITARAAEWIRLHCGEGISAKDVSAALGYNGDYLTQIFREETGMTISEKINGCRLDSAKKLLLNSDMRISEVALQVGFGDVKYFMKLFKKSENATPTEYRRSFYHIHLNVK